MNTRLIYLIEYNVAQYSLIQERSRNLLIEILLIEITREQTVGTMIDMQIHNIIVINIVYLNTIIIIRTLVDLITCWVNLDVEMIFLIAPYNHRITFNQRILIQRHGSMVVDELLQIRLIFRFHQLNHIPILHFKLENMLSLFYNRIFCNISTLHYKRITSNVEVDRLTG